MPGRSATMNILPDEASIARKAWPPATVEEEAQAALTALQVPEDTTLATHDARPIPIPSVITPEESNATPTPTPKPEEHVPPPPVLGPEPPPSSKATPAAAKTTTSRRRQRSDSVTTFHGGGAETIFRLLPRETRPALRRMLHVEPSARCTLTDLLKGRGKTSGLLCGCDLGKTRDQRRRETEEAAMASSVSLVQTVTDLHQQQREAEERPESRATGRYKGKQISISGTDSPPNGAVHCQDHDEDTEDEDEGDDWIKSINSCSTPLQIPQHVHVKVQVDEKAAKRRFF